MPLPLRLFAPLSLGLLFFCLAPLADAQAPVVEAPARGPATTVPSDGNTRAHPAWFASCEKRVAEMHGKPCDLIFIGDSITDNLTARPTPQWELVGRAVWDKYYAGRNALNFGLGADATQHVLWRLEHMAIKEFHPKVSVILVGTNNNKNTPEEIADGVKAVVAKTRAVFPGTKVILISILPNARATQKMADANVLIAPLADDKSIFYIDLAAKMPREGNNWKGIGRDHLHLTLDGYELWATEMEPLLTRLLAQP